MQKRILSRAGKRMGQRTNAKQAASTVTGRRRLRQGRVALFVPGASKCNGHTPTGGKSDEAETRLAMLVGAASYAWGFSAAPRALFPLR